MARILFFLFLCITVAGSGRIPAMAQDFTIDQHIDTTFTSTLEGKAGKAMVVGIINGAEKTVINFGEEPASEETVYDIGSITKVFTGVALSRAIVEGTLTPDTSICELDPELFGEGNVLCAITVADVATHRSGLPRMPANLDAFSNRQDPFGNYSVEKLKEYVTEWDGYEEKEHTYMYSNIATGLLGHLLVTSSGFDDYDALMQETLLEELDMQSTSYHFFVEEGGQKIQGHGPLGFATADWTGETLAGMGLLRSNVQDMMKFMQAYFDLPQYADQDSTELQKTLRLSMMPLRPLRDARPDSVAYFWHIRQVEENKRYWWHNGMTGGYTTFMAFDPNQKKGVIALFNQVSYDYTSKWMALVKKIMY